MQPQALNCPNCGGAVSSDRTQCEFCKSRLKTVACASCLGLMFLGSKFCDHCGREAKNVEVFVDERVGDCPRCKRPLESLRIQATPVRECMGCGGFWTSAQTFESICADKEEQSAVLTFITTQTFDSRATAPINYVPCPDCKQLMNRSNFARSSGVIIDLCKEHGVWFDADELPKIIDFIDKGGLTRAREKQKMAIEEQRAKLRDDQRNFEMMVRRRGGGSGGYYGNPDVQFVSNSILSILFDLYDGEI
jgi:Zn-finger nucleic acid-binding protein